MNATAQNPEFAAYGSNRMRWIGEGELRPAVRYLRDANDYLRGSRLARTTGYYVDDMQEDTAVPAVYVVVSDTDDSEEEDLTYWAAVRDPLNEGGGLVDFEESYRGPEEAARAAHSLTERYAEEAREYSENETNKIRLENMLDDVTELRRRHRYLIRALSAIGDDASGARVRENVRNDMARLVEDIRELRTQINLP